MTNINLYVLWKHRNVEQYEKKVTFSKELTLNEFIKYLCSDILFIKIPKGISQPQLMWGKCNMTIFLNNSLETFFVDGNTVSIQCPDGIEWDQNELKELTINETDFLEPIISKTTTIENHDIFLIENFFSKKECELLIRMTENTGFASINYNKSYRSNDRLMTQSIKLMQIVFNRILQYECIPKKFDNWIINNVNPQFRFCRYRPGQHFSKHLDGRFIKTDDEKSFLTLNIYLNENFENGTIRFYLDEKDQSIITQTFKPKVGLAVIFNHETKSYLHDGEMVSNGVKYLLRTDIMYKKEKEKEL